jgi:hypothetical protein
MTFAYQMPDEVLVYLINEEVNAPTESRRLAAKFILDCLRVYPTKQEIGECIDDLKKDAMLEIAPDVEKLAETLGLIH